MLQLSHNIRASGVTISLEFIPQHLYWATIWAQTLTVLHHYHSILFCHMVCAGVAHILSAPVHLFLSDRNKDTK